jgi:hypothetical protein
MGLSAPSAAWYFRGTRQDRRSVLKRLVLAVLLLGAASVAGAPAPLERRERPERSPALRPFQGTWEWAVILRLTEIEQGVWTHKKSGLLTAVVTGDRIRFSGETKGLLERSVTIRLTPRKAGDEGELILRSASTRRVGVYKFRGDRLLIRLAAPGEKQAANFDVGRTGEITICLQRKPPRTDE